MDLPFDDDEAELVYAGHVMEHISEWDVPRALEEIRRVLRPDGALMVVGPDVELAGGDPELERMIIEGAHRWPGDEHRWEQALTTAAMRQFLDHGGWQVVELPIELVPARWPLVSRVGWQFALLARP